MINNNFLVCLKKLFSFIEYQTVQLNTYQKEKAYESSCYISN